jgi:prepilin-type processing-associated H-X9-DG protein
MTQINTFLCPSDPNATGVEASGIGPANNCYFGSIGTTTDVLGTNSSSPATNGSASLAAVKYSGLFAFQQSKGFNQVTDGTSNTVAFAESTVGSGTPQWGQKLIGMNSVSSIPAAALQYDALSDPTDVQAGLAACSAAYKLGGKPANIDAQRGDSWAIGGIAMTLFNTVATPNANNDQWAYCGKDSSGTFANFSNADSYHSGGVNVLMTDGHVQFIKDSINSRTWWCLGTIAGGEVIDASSY